MPVPEPALQPDPRTAASIMEQEPTSPGITSSNALRYFAFGFLYGLYFPVTVTMMDLNAKGLPFGLESILAVQTSHPYIWFFDLLPPLTGLLASLAGKRQDVIHRLNRELEAKVAARTADLTAANAYLEGEIAERKRVEEQLLGAKVEAERANTAKSAFLANMSHELRTPLNAIIGYAGLLLEEPDLESLEDVQKDVTKIQKAGQKLLGLINDILDIAKVEAGRVDVNQDRFRLEALISDTRSTSQPLAEARSNSFRIDCDEPHTELNTDRVRVQQILTNLLSNACKFTENGEIVLSITFESEVTLDWVVFEVRDTGIGIDAAEREAIFQSFSQADTSSTRKFGGTGLGLTIIQKVVTLLGGSIDLESEKGQGSTFRVRLPADYEEYLRYQDRFGPGSH